MDIENHSTLNSDFLASPMETMMQVGLGISLGQQMARNISDYVFNCNKQQILQAPFIPPSTPTELLYFVAQKTTYIGPFPINEILRKMGEGSISTERGASSCKACGKTNRAMLAIDSFPETEIALFFYSFHLFLI